MTTTNTAEFDRARRVIPGGVDSPVRAYGSVGGTPRFVARARGPLVWDVEGREYVDLVCSWGPALLGHAHPEVVAAVTEAAERGLSFGAPRDQDDWRYPAFFAAMLEAGVTLPPSVYEAWFLSAAHDDAALDRILTALPGAARAAADAAPTPA